MQAKKEFMKDTVQVRIATGQRQTVEGWAFFYDGLKLVAHKNIVGSGWTVTEPKSGMAMGNIAKSSRKEAVAVAIQSLEKQGTARIEELIEKALKSEEKAKEDQARAKKIQEEDDRKQGRKDAESFCYEHYKKPNYLAIMKSERETMAKNGNSEKSLSWMKGYLDKMDQNIRFQEGKEARVKEEEEKLAREAEEPVQEEKIDPEVEEKPKKKWNIASFFKGIGNMDELKKAYKKFAKWLHPDISIYENAEEAFKAMKDQYDKAVKLVEAGKTVEEAASNIDPDLDAMLQEVLSKINHLEGIEIVVKGSWIWVSGLTPKDKDKHAVLKEAGFRFKKATSEWYFAGTAPGGKRRKGSGLSPDEISEKYGEQRVKRKRYEQVAEKGTGFQA
jgi:hypothetical protein